ncbi:MAG: hypothetical protein J3Q66DRAFT_332417 [Benniella sp.]|nr:MAG: hypothetical protein J3Q66DRAFT_332417 [Benniella sp.]
MAELRVMLTRRNRNRVWGGETHVVNRETCWNLRRRKQFYGPNDCRVFRLMVMAGVKLFHTLSESLPFQFLLLWFISPKVANNDGSLTEGARYGLILSLTIEKKAATARVNRTDVLNIKAIDQRYVITSWVVSPSLDLVLVYILLSVLGPVLGRWQRILCERA